MKAAKYLPTNYHGGINYSPDYTRDMVVGQLDLQKKKSSVGIFFRCGWTYNTLAIHQIPKHSK